MPDAARYIEQPRQTLPWMSYLTDFGSNLANPSQPSDILDWRLRHGFEKRPNQCVDLGPEVHNHLFASESRSFGGQQGAFRGARI